MELSITMIGISVWVSTGTRLQCGALTGSTECFSLKAVHHDNPTHIFLQAI